MNPDHLTKILEYVGEHSPLHCKKLKKNLPLLESHYRDKVNSFFESYLCLLSQEGKDLNYALSCYLRMCNDMMFEQLRFAETGRYSCTSFSEVNARVYSDPEVMNYYMHGLLISQYLWIHHYKVFQFFSQNIETVLKNSKQLLEIGGGHGLYTNEVISKLQSEVDYIVVDISQTSIAMSKSLVKNQTVEYVLADIFQYETDKKFDLIIMGEILEHVEEPLALLNKVHALGTDDVTVFITVPCNAPAIDHIYLFRNPDEIRALLHQAGWQWFAEHISFLEASKPGDTDNPLAPVIYAAFLKKFR